MLGFIVVAAIAAVPDATPPCRATQIALRLDGKDGDFSGMSHSGTLVVLRNRGSACRIEGLPRITFRNARGQALPIVRNVPVGMHPGPVVLPVTIAAGGEVSTPLRWVSGEVYDHSRCLSPARLAVAIGGRRVATPLRQQICGPADKPAGFDQPPLRTGTDTSAPG